MKFIKTKALSFLNWIYQFLDSRLAFGLAILLLAINSLWIAVSALYPMAYDEQFHLGLIRLYTTKLSPFWQSNPPGEALFGAVARDPSYLYHYLMSFPYRIISQFTDSEFAQVLILRFSSILLFIIGLYIFRKVLHQAKISNRITNASLLIFVLLPIVPLLAAHINYDNLLFVFFGLVLLYAQRFLNKLKTKNIFDIKTFTLLTIICMFGTLIKYAFLPFVLGIVIYFGFSLVRHYLSNAKTTQLAIKTMLADMGKSFRKLSTIAKFSLLALIVLFTGLFLERYLINTVNYKTPTPECDQVLSVEECLAYGPWRRNYYTRQAKLENRLEKVYSSNPVRYVITLWLSETTFQLFFAIDGATYDFRVGEPFRILRNSSVAVMLIGLVLIIYHRKYLRNKYNLGLIATGSSVYIGALLILNYSEFINLGYPFAIQGRYLIPILIPVIAVMALSLSKQLGDTKNRKSLKSAIFLVAFLTLLTQGGGAGTYILRSYDSWYWSGNFYNQVNHQARNVLKIVNLDKRIP